MSDMRNTLVKADEFALYVLAHLMNCLAVVDLKGSIWSTIKNAGNLTHDQLLDECDVHLVYMGKLKFLELSGSNDNSNVDNINSILAALKYDPKIKCEIRLVDIGNTLEVKRKHNLRPSNSPEYDPEEKLTEKAKPRIKGKVKCGICGLKVIMKKALNYHCEQSHDRIRCNTCKKEFKYHTSLLQHKYVHCRPIYNCPQCERRFSFLSQPRIHHNIHLKNHKYKCQFKNCRKKFTRPYDLSQQKQLILTKLQM